MKKEEIGKTVQTLRKLKGLSQERLAELCDISSAAVSNAERGGSWCPSVRTLEKLSEVLDFPFLGNELKIIKIPMTLADIPTRDLLKELERRCSGGK